MTQLQQHPLSAIFPSLPDDELNALAADIKAHGLHETIVLYEGKVLDGWHRTQACARAGVNPRTVVYRGSDPVAYVKSKNWHRRHLTASQRGFTETGLAEWRPAGIPGQTGKIAGLEKSNAEMAAESGTSERTIRQSKAVHTNGSDTLKEAVKEGKIAVSVAAEVAKLPKEKQAKAMAEPKKKKAKPAPKPDDDSCSVAELGKALEESDKEVRGLQALVESLKKNDLAKEVAKWHLKFDQLEGRLALAVKQKNEADKHAKYSTGLLRKIREALKVTKDSEILQAIRTS